jgi:hypothetical protein
MGEVKVVVAALEERGRVRHGREHAREKRTGIEEGADRWGPLVGEKRKRERKEREGRGAAGLLGRFGSRAGLVGFLLFLFNLFPFDFLICFITFSFELQMSSKQFLKFYQIQHNILKQ